MHELFRKGDHIQSHGGLFVVDPSNEDFGIEAIHYQTALFTQYALTYGVNQLIFIDGTHNLNHRKSTAIIWSGIDGLLRTKFMGAMDAFSSEHSKPIVRGAKLFFPGDEVFESSNSTNTYQVGEFPVFLIQPLIPRSVSSVLEKIMWGRLFYPVTTIKTQHLASMTTPIQSQSTMKLLAQNLFLSEHPTSLLCPSKHQTYIPTKQP